jgi:hypothetical protein
MVSDESRTTAINCTFAGNEASCGGGIYNNSAEMMLINGVLIGNVADRGGAIANLFTSPDIVNCTFSANTAFEEGGAIHNEYDSNPSLANCILWADAAPAGPEIANTGDSIPRIGYCDIQASGGSGGGWDADLGVDGGGNIDADPLFADPGGDEFSLAASSPCIDAGINSAVPADGLDLDDDGDTAERIPIDRAGDPRFADDPDTPDTGCGVPAVVDMGAYEFPGEVIEKILIGDIDGDGDVDTADLLTLLGAWGPCEADCCLADINTSGAVDTADLLLLLGNWG